MGCIPFIAVLILLNSVMNGSACFCPEEIKCTSQNCQVKRKYTIPSESQSIQTWQYYPCNLVCLYSEIYKSNCSTVEELQNVCRCGTAFYVVSSGSKWFCIPHTSCPPGQGVEVMGSGSADTVCKKCETGIEFSPTNSSTDRCQPCGHCDGNLGDVITGCSPTSNTVCQNITGTTDSKRNTDYPSKSDLKLEQQQMTEIIIATNLAGIIIIIGVISVVMVVLYRKGMLHCLRRTARQDTETILRNSDADFIDTEHPELNADADRDGSESYQTARTLTDIDNDSIDDPASVSYDRVASWQLHRPNSCRMEDTLSERRLPKSRSLPQGLGGTEQPQRYVPRNTYSFHEDLQLNRLQSGGTRKPVYPFHRALTDLSYHLCGIEWEMFFRRLIGEGSDAILGRVKRDHAISVREQIYHMLLEWKNMWASEATLNVIIKELEDCNENLLASVYRRKLPHVVYP